jgi:hypothetical protein
MEFKKQFREELIKEDAWISLTSEQRESVVNIAEQQLQLYVVNYRRELLKFLGDEITKVYDEGDRIYDGNLFIEDVAKDFNCS